MGVLENISEVLAANEAKRERIKNIILLLMLEWKDFDSNLELAEKCLQEGLDEMQFRESHLNSLQESVSKSSEEMDVIRKSIEERLKVLEDKEKGFDLDQERWTKELLLKQEAFNLIRKEFAIKEEKLNEHEKLVQVLFEKIEMEQKEFEVVGKLVGEQFSEIELKDNQMKKRVNELDLQEQKLRQREKEVELREKILDLKNKEIELREREIYSAKISRKQSSIPDSGATQGRDNFHMPGVDDMQPSGSREVKNKHRNMGSADDVASSSKKLRWSKPYDCCQEEQKNTTCHVCSGCGNLTCLWTEEDMANARMVYKGSSHLCSKHF